MNSQISKAAIIPKNPKSLNLYPKTPNPQEPLLYNTPTGLRLKTLGLSPKVSQAILTPNPQYTDSAMDHSWECFTTRFNATHNDQ